MKTVTEKCALIVNYEKRTLPLQHSRMLEAARRLQNLSRSLWFTVAGDTMGKLVGMDVFRVLNHTSA